MKTNVFLSLSRSALIAVVTSLLCCLPAGLQQAQILILGGFGTTTSGSASFQGGATAVAGTVAGGAVSVSDTGALAASGGALEVSALETAVASGVAVGASHATVIGGGTVSSCEASVANVNLRATSMLGMSIITADFVMARAEAGCINGVAIATGEVLVDNLVINGQAIAVTGMANQFVFLADGGYVIINEQSAGVGAITVHAMHVVDVFAGVDVVFGSAVAGITCPSTTGTGGGGGGGGTSGPPPCDFITGGGWITGTPSGAKGNFGVAGGVKNGAFWGHLNYIDHGNGMHVKATAVTGYEYDPANANCRYIDYNVTIDGQAGTARVHVCDNGEPGRNDIFEIRLSNGYAAGGDLGGNHPGGGNIQLHRCQ